MASQPWIHCRYKSERQAHTRLQWSHGLPAMDTLSAHGNLLWYEELQWSHGLPAIDTLAPPTASPTISSLQWSHGLPAMDTRRIPGSDQPDLPCFNGAMASQPWILVYPPIIPPAPSRFNGAMASQPWIPPQHTVFRRLRSSLQWSHGLPAMDTSRGGSACLWPRVLQWSHGLPAMDTYAVSVIRIYNNWLQWSHGLPAMDTSAKVWAGARVAWLQWSHGLPAMDTRRACTMTRAQRIASMEPWPPSHGYQRRRSTAPRSARASMEPWPPSHGYDGVRGRQAVRFSLQWSHGLPAMDTSIQDRRNCQLD